MQEPARAVAESLRRLGWDLISPFRWKTPKGLEALVDDVAPGDLVKLLRFDAQDWVWKQSAANRDLYSNLTATPLLKPLHSILRKPPNNNWSGIRVTCAAIPGHNGIRIGVVVLEMSFGGSMVSTLS